MYSKDIPTSTQNEFSCKILILRIQDYFPGASQYINIAVVYGEGIIPTTRFMQWLNDLLSALRIKGFCSVHNKG